MATHPSYDSYWKQWSIEEEFSSIQVPALTIGAWYDIFLDGSLRNYLGMKSHAGNVVARGMQRLIVAIGGHSGMGRVVGTVDFGPDAPLDPYGLAFDWYDYLFMGKQNEFATGKHVRIFVMGENKWRDEDDWPLDRADATHYYLRSSGNANSAAGDGSLTTMPAHREQADSYIYDPADPVPTVGGPLCCDVIHLPAGPQKQNNSFTAYCGTAGKITALGCWTSCSTVFVAFTNSEESAALLPVLRLRSNRGKLLLETSTRIWWPFRNTLLVADRSILYS